ncbi:MAG: sulfatase [Bryobacteraceae bacterium]
MADLRRREFLLTGAAGLAPKGAGRPNIVVIVTDQQHIDSIAAAGNRYLRTPAMDHLYRTGASFALSHSPDPVCSPARSAIFTGRMPSETDVASNGRPIRAGIPNLGEWFGGQANYETVYAGKWHLPRTYTTRIPGFRVLPGGIGGQGNLGDTSVSRSCEAYLRGRRSSEPFLLVASFLQPHDICEWLRLNMRNPEKLPHPQIAGELPPLPANFAHEEREPAALRRIRQRAEPAEGRWNEPHWRYYLWSYYRHVEMVDGEVGRILEALHDTGRDRNTVVLLTADHGEGLGQHGMVRKSFSYDAALKVPFLISCPGRIPEGRNDAAHPVSGVDVMPTLCDYAGIAPPPRMRGRSVRPLVEGRAAGGGDFIVSEIPANVGRVVRTGRYKYVTFAGDPVEQLFDMQPDPGETRNVAADSRYAGALADHRKLLREWESRLEKAPGLPHAEAWAAL